MGLDIRFPVGGLFALLGALLAGYGLFGGPALSQRSLGIDIDLWWGGLMLAFGALMLLFGWRARHKPPAPPSAGG